MTGVWSQSRGLAGNFLDPTDIERRSILSINSVYIYAYIIQIGSCLQGRNQVPGFATSLDDFAYGCHFGNYSRLDAQQQQQLIRHTSCIMQYRWPINLCVCVFRPGIVFGARPFQPFADGWPKIVPRPCWPSSSLQLSHICLCDLIEFWAS